MSLSKIQVPVLERVALSLLAERRGEPEGVTLTRIIREAVRRDLVDCDAQSSAAASTPSAADRARGAVTP